MSRDPQLDSLPPSPVDWEPIPLGIGQQPNAMGHDGAFQFTQDANEFSPADSVRRNPADNWKWISRVPERP